MLVTSETKVECSAKGEYMITHLHGWNYRAVLNKKGQISRIGCPFRFSMTDVKLIGQDFIITAVKQAIKVFVAFEQYDVLEIDWQEGNGWQQYSTLKEKWEYQLAVYAVNGENLPSTPHWVKRKDIKFRIVNQYGAVKLTEDGRI